MNFIIKLTLFDSFKWQNGQLCLVCDAEPKPHPLITPDFKARIVVDGFIDRPLNGLGQLMLARHRITELNSKTFVSVKDNIDDILEYKGKKTIVIYVEVSDEIQKAMELSNQKNK